MHPCYGWLSFFIARTCIGSCCTVAALDAAASALTCTLPRKIRGRCAGVYTAHLRGVTYWTLTFPVIVHLPRFRVFSRVIPIPIFFPCNFVLLITCILGVLYKLATYNSGPFRKWQPRHRKGRIRLRNLWETHQRL